jgi:Zn-dependent protease
LLLARAVSGRNSADKIAAPLVAAAAHRNSRRERGTDTSVFSCIGAAVCALLWLETGDAFWIGLASLSALLNVLNLIPIWVLDGGQAIAALNKTERIVLSAAAVLFAALFGQPAFLLVAGGAGYRVFSKDIPEEPSHTAMAYYLLVLAALGYIIKLAPMLPPGR